MWPSDRLRSASALGLLLPTLSILPSAFSEEIVLSPPTSSGPRSWRLGERIPVECLNRTIDWGEHVTDSKGNLQYIPFPTCLETGRPLELVFGSETDINCTLAALSDPLFHLFEFYIHDDAPLSCRMPALASGSSSAKEDYTRMQIALTGTLQLSHLHINPQLNVVVHTTAGPGDDGDDDDDNDKAGAASEGSTAAKQKAKKKNKDKTKSKGGIEASPVSEGRLLAAAAYSLPPTSLSPRIVIGDALPLRLSVRWFSERTLPASTSRLEGLVPPSGLGGHVHFSTVLYCLLSFGGGVAVSLAYWRGIELPRRMRRYGAERLGYGGMGMGMGEARGGYAFPGKRD